MKTFLILILSGFLALAMQEASLYEKSHAEASKEGNIYIFHESSPKRAFKVIATDKITTISGKWSQIRDNAVKKAKKYPLCEGIIINTNITGIVADAEAQFIVFQ